MDWKAYLRFAWGNFDKIVLLGGWALSAGILPYLLSLNSGVTPIGYGLASVFGILSFASLRALWARTKLWRIEANHREKLAGNSSAFDPMAETYLHKQLFLRDLIPPGRRHLVGRKFINCEIIGPGNIVVALNDHNGNSPVFRNNIFNDVDCIQIESGIVSNNATYFPGCDFDGCNFYNLNLLFFERPDTNWHWITPVAAQTLLLEGPDNEGNG